MIHENEVFLPLHPNDLLFAVKNPATQSVHSGLLVTLLNFPASQLEHIELP